MEHTLDAALLMLKGVNEKNKKKEDNVKNVDDRTTSDSKYNLYDLADKNIWVFLLAFRIFNVICTLQFF